MSAKAGMVGFTIELRDTGDFGFALPASQIIPVGEEIWAAIKFYIQFLIDNNDIPQNHLSRKRRASSRLEQQRNQELINEQ